MIRNIDFSDFVQLFNVENDNVIRVVLPQHIAELLNFSTHSTSFINNFRNIRSDFNNNILFLTPTYSINIVDSH